MSVSIEQKVNRIFYVDNLRLFLIVLVILHHVAVAYGGSGGWPLKETPTDSISPIFLLLFNAINQSFFMSLFYMLSGYFVPRSYDRKGAGRFLLGRLIRLGIPLVVYTTVIATFVDFLVVRVAQGQSILIREMLIARIRQPRWNVGPLWFVEALLIFSVVYVLVRTAMRKSPRTVNGGCPSNMAITLSILGIAVGTFVVRIWYPVGKQFHVFQLGHFVHYAFCFWVGIVAFRRKWFDGLSPSRARTWKAVAVLSIRDDTASWRGPGHSREGLDCGRAQRPALFLAGRCDPANPIYQKSPGVAATFFFSGLVSLTAEKFVRAA